MRAMKFPAPTEPAVSRDGDRRAVLEMAAAALCFATMSSLAHGMRDHIAWAAIACTRIAVTVFFVYLLMILTRTRPVVRGNIAVWGRSLFGSMGLLGTFYAVTHLPVTDTVTIYATGPIWITVILVTVFRHKVHAAVWLHALLALAGVWVMHRPAFNSESFPLLAALGGAFAAACAKVSLRFLSRVDNLAIIAHYSTCGFLISAAAALYGGEGALLHPAVDPRIWLWLFPMGLAGTLAQVLMTAAYRRGRTPLVALAGISQIIFAALYDVFLFGHPFSAAKAIGVTMIVLAIILSIRTGAKETLGS
jgi:drug/metabolite transporter (DMT)-like permease